MIFNMGPATIRWVGNEDGLACDPVHYVTASADLNNYDDDVIESAVPRYLPPECDVSLRRGWFWQPGEEPKSLPHLLAIHDRSIGLGANLLLNIPPDRRGRIDPQDAARVRELARALHERFGSPHEGELVSQDDGVVQVALGDETGLDHIELVERLEEGQRVHRHRVLAEDGTELAVEARRRAPPTVCPPWSAPAARIEPTAKAVLEAVRVTTRPPVPDLGDAHRRHLGAGGSVAADADGATRPRSRRRRCVKRPLSTARRAPTGRSPAGSPLRWW